LGGAIVMIDRPTWTLANTVCPVCESLALTLVSCPGCSGLSLVCAECDEHFTDIGATSVAAKDTPCKSCGNFPIEAFSPASGEQAQQAGLAISDYA
jgi:hypothetical protein